MRRIAMPCSKSSGWSVRGSLLIALLTACFLLVAAGFVFASEEGNAEVIWKATDWFRLMNFGVLAVAVFFLARKPVSKALNGRIQGIEQDLKSLEAQKAEAEKQLNEYNNRIASLDKEVEKIISDYRRQGEEAKGKILAAAKESAVKIEEQAKRNIANEFEIARQKLQEDIFHQAVVRAEVLVKEKINAKDQDRLVEEYLNKVVLQ